MKEKANNLRHPVLQRSHMLHQCASRFSLSSLDSFKLFSQLEPSKVAVLDIGHHTDIGDRGGGVGGET